MLWLWRGRRLELEKTRGALERRRGGGIRQGQEQDADAGGAGKRVEKALIPERPLGNPRRPAGTGAGRVGCAGWQRAYHPPLCPSRPWWMTRRMCPWTLAMKRSWPSGKPRSGMSGPWFGQAGTKIASSFIYSLIFQDVQSTYCMSIDQAAPPCSSLHLKAQGGANTTPAKILTS